MYDLYEFAFQIAGYFCHQIPERSIFIGGAQFPLCFRCASLLVGGLGAFAFLVTRAPVPPASFCLLMTLPMAFELSLSSMGIVEGSNILRAATALLFGFFFLIGSLQWLAGYTQSYAIESGGAPRGYGKKTAKKSRGVPPS
jgi:uncharacterized membrane protein